MNELPPKPEFNASHVLGEDGISRPMNLFQRMEAKLDWLIECEMARRKSSFEDDDEWPDLSGVTDQPGSCVPPQEGS